MGRIFYAKINCLKMVYIILSRIVPGETFLWGKEHQQIYLQFLRIDFRHFGLDFVGGFRIFFLENVQIQKNVGECENFRQLPSEHFQRIDEHRKPVVGVGSSNVLSKHTAHQFRAQYYKTFYCCNLPPFHGHTIILCYKATLPW